MWVILCVYTYKCAYMHACVKTYICSVRVKFEMHLCKSWYNASFKTSCFEEGRVNLLTCFFKLLQKLNVNPSLHLSNVDAF